MKLMLKAKPYRSKKSSLEELNLMKNQILSIISHDLRGPIGSLKRMLDYFDQGGISAEQFKKVASSMKTNVDSLYLTLDNLLNWAKHQMDGFKIETSTFLLNESVENTLEFFKSALREKNLILKMEVANRVLVRADKNHTEIIIRNLISNAIKFSNPNSQIIISHYSNQTSECLTVQDFGIGINAEELALLKTWNLQKSKYGTVNEKGTGIGLLICHKFAELNGGEIRIESEEGKGSTFSICLPKA